MEQTILYYDGLCVLCNNSMRFIINRDRKKQFKIGFLDELKNIEQQWYGQLVKEYWLLEKIDFDDLLIRPKSMLEKNEDSLKKKSKI